MAEIIIKLPELTEFVVNVLEKLEVPAPDAKIVSDCMGFAHLRGFDTHGLPCLAGYVECLEQGQESNPGPTSRSKSPCPGRSGSTPTTAWAMWRPIGL